MQASPLYSSSFSLTDKRITSINAREYCNAVITTSQHTYYTAYRASTLLLFRRDRDRAHSISKPYVLSNAPSNDS